MPTAPAGTTITLTYHRVSGYEIAAGDWTVLLYNPAVDNYEIVGSSGDTNGWGVLADSPPGSLAVSIPVGAAVGNYRVFHGDAFYTGQTDTEDFTVSSPPAAPTGLVATAGNAQVALTWTSVSGATSYPVERQTVTEAGPSPWAQIGNAGTNAYTDFSAVNGRLYNYRVKATGSGGTSGPSSVVSATPTGGGGGTPAFANLWAAGDAPADDAFAAAPNLVDNAADDAVTGYDGT